MLLQVGVKCGERSWYEDGGRREEEGWWTMRECWKGRKGGWAPASTDDVERQTELI
jgi:hypothetical protein